MRLSAFGTPATNEAVLSVGMVEAYGALDKMRTDSESQSTRRKFPPLLICSQ
jgi:hypothetical protein